MPNNDALYMTDEWNDHEPPMLCYSKKFTDAIPEMLEYYSGERALRRSLDFHDGDSFSAGYLMEDLGIEEKIAEEIMRILIKHECITRMHGINKGCYRVNAY